MSCVSQSSAATLIRLGWRVYKFAALKSRDLTSRDLTMRHQIKQWCYNTVESNMLNDKRIKSRLSRFDSGA